MRNEALSEDMCMVIVGLTFDSDNSNDRVCSYIAKINSVLELKIPELHINHASVLKRMQHAEQRFLYFS